ALLTAAAGLLALSQGFGRQSRVVAETYPALSALGMGFGDLAALNLARAFAIGLLGAVGGVVLAVALSPLTPVGVARTAELHPGLAFDALVIGAGVGATVLGTVLAALWPAVRTARLRRR